MWVLYLRRVGQSLWTTLLLTGLMLIFPMESLVVPVMLLPMMLIFPAAFSLIKYLLDRFFVHAPPRSKILLTIMLALPLSLSSLLFFSHIFLFFNALPLAVSLTFIGVTTFFTVFEGLIRIKPDLGPDFSLVKLMLSPRTSIVRLRELLYRPEPAAARAGLRRNNNLEDILRQLHDIENRQPAFRRANQPAPRAPVGEPEALRLPENDRAKLLKRHLTATQKLPKAAIIPDVVLYNKYVAQETASGLIRKTQEAANRRKQPPITSVALTAQINQAIQTEALKQTLTEATRLEKAYEETLSPSQAEHYRAYREVTRNFSPPYAECTIAFDSVNDNPHREFIIMEKRVVTNNNTTLTEELIPGKTFIWSYANGFQPLFGMNSHTAEEPSSRDQFFAENGKITGYVFHTYEVVNGHSLSLGLCEHIEKFLKSLQLSAANDKKPSEANAVQTSSSSSYRAAPISPLANISNMSIYAAAGRYDYDTDLHQPACLDDDEPDHDQEFQNYLATLDDDELALNYGYRK